MYVCMCVYTTGLLRMAKSYAKEVADDVSGERRIPQAMLNFSPLNDRYAGKLITINYAALCNFTAGAHAQTTYSASYLPACLLPNHRYLARAPRLSPRSIHRRDEESIVSAFIASSHPRNPELMFLFSLSLFVISRTFDRPIASFVAEDRPIRVSKLLLSESFGSSKNRALTNLVSH